MKKTCFSRRKKSSKIRTIKAGSVQIKVYSGKLKGHPIFTVYWHLGEKSYRKVFADPDKAESYAREQAERLAAGQVNAPTISVTDAQTYREAVRRLGPHDIPLHVVASEYASAVDKLKNAGTLHQAVEFYLRNTTRPDMERTVPLVLEEMIEAKKLDGVSNRYIEDLRHRLGRFAKDFQTPISYIQTREISDWLRKLKCGPRSRNNIRALIVSLFSFARKQGYYSAERLNPAINVDRAKVRGGAIVIFTRSELAEMLAVASKYECLAIAIGAFGGIRQAEILRLRWENFNWEEQVIDLGSDQTKTASRRLVPILPALTAWIAPYRREHGRMFPFDEDSGFYRVYKSVVEKVNAARPEDQRDFAWKKNGLRHSYASYRLALVEDVGKVSLEMGNSPQKVFNNYRKVVTKSQATGWFAVMPTAPENVVPLSIAV